MNKTARENQFFRAVFIEKKESNGTVHFFEDNEQGLPCQIMDHDLRGSPCILMINPIGHRSNR